MVLDPEEQGEDDSAETSSIAFGSPYNLCGPCFLHDAHLWVQTSELFKCSYLANLDVSYVLVIRREYVQKKIVSV